MQVSDFNFPTQSDFTNGATYTYIDGAVSVTIERVYGQYRIEVWAPERDALTNEFAGPSRRVSRSERSWLVAKHWALHYRNV